MKSPVHLLTCALLLLAGPLPAWENVFVEVENIRRESAWRYALAEKLNAEQEISIDGGRVDVLTPKLAIEVDWPHKWHEGLGQALHYADATGRTGALALISYSKNPESMRPSTRDRLELVDRQCVKNGIHLMVLFAESDEKISTPAPDTPPAPFWLNTQSGTIHRPGCRYFENTTRGRRAWPTEGRACRQCPEERKNYKGHKKP